MGLERDEFLRIDLGHINIYIIRYLYVSIGMSQTDLGARRDYCLTIDYSFRVVLLSFGGCFETWGGIAGSEKRLNYSNHRKRFRLGGDFPNVGFQRRV